MEPIPPNPPAEEFICEALEPIGGFDTAGMARGAPGLPGGFRWRGQEHAIVQVVRQWKTSSREGGVGELYLRRHWWCVVTDTGLRMTVYCDRQTQARRPKARWWVYTVARVV